MEELSRVQWRSSLGNQTSGDIYNVDLRVNHPGVYSISKYNLLQLGTIPAGEAQVHLASFMFSEEFFASKEPIIWAIDYDDASSALCGR